MNRRAQQWVARWALQHILRFAAEVALYLSRRGAADRFDGPAGETASELEHLTGVLVDWSFRLNEVREASRAKVKTGG